MAALPILSGSCAVCGDSDARALQTTRLTTGEVIVVCGTHALMHERAPARARSSAQLKEMVRQKRARMRRSDEGDELAATLSAAFAAERRTKSDRRS